MLKNEWVYNIGSENQNLKISKKIEKSVITNKLCNLTGQTTLFSTLWSRLLFNTEGYAIWCQLWCWDALSSIIFVLYQKCPSPIGLVLQSEGIVDGSLQHGCCWGGNIVQNGDRARCGSEWAQNGTRIEPTQIDRVIKKSWRIIGRSEPSRRWPVLEDCS